MEKSRIKITYRDETRNQLPELLISKEWYSDENPDKILEKSVIYYEHIQFSEVYHENQKLFKGYDTMLKLCKVYLNEKENIKAVKTYKLFTNTTVKEAHKFIKTLDEYQR